MSFRRSSSIQKRIRVPSPRGTSSITPPPSMNVSGVRGLTSVTQHRLALDITESLVAFSKSHDIDPCTMQRIGDVVTQLPKIVSDILQALDVLVLENSESHGLDINAAVVIWL